MVLRLRRLSVMWLLLGRSQLLGWYCLPLRLPVQLVHKTEQGGNEDCGPPRDKSGFPFHRGRRLQARNRRHFALQIVRAKNGLVKFHVHDTAQGDVERGKFRAAGNRAGRWFGGDEKQADVGEVEEPLGLTRGLALSRGKPAEGQRELHIICSDEEAFAGVPGGRGAGRTGVETHRSTRRRERGQKVSA
jgi:hypothetical protein